MKSIVNHLNLKPNDIEMPAEKAKVSIIIPTYNRSHLLLRSVQSILNQTYKEFEIIIVDDGSIDNTEEVIKTIRDPRIKYIKNLENKGACAARNTGIKAAKYEYIAFQDSDDEWCPEKLEKQMECFKKAAPNVGVVYTGFQRIKNDIKTYIPSPSIPKRSGNIHEILLNGNFVTTQVAIVKKECFDKVGMFDERLPRLQDWELWIRVSKYYCFEFIDEPLVKAYYQIDSISSNHGALIQAWELILEKHFNSREINRKILSSQFFEIGKYIYLNQYSDKWKRYYLKSYMYAPLNFKLILIIIFSLFRKEV